MTIKAVPIFEQVDQNLRARIYNGEFEAGIRMPSESALAAELGVSRATIRMVLGKLEAEGIVSRRHGDGTYVNKNVLGVDAIPTRKMAFKNMIEETGRVARVIMVSFLDRFPTEEEAERLKISKKEGVSELVNFFLADEQPFAYSINLYPSKIFRNKSEEFDVFPPIDAFVKLYTTEQIAYSVSHIIAATAPERIAEYLKISTNEPILKSYDLFYNLHNKPIVFGTNYYHNETYRLRIAQPW